MNWVSSSEFLGEIQQHANQYLTETFQKMFQLDIAMLPGMQQSAEHKRMLSSHMELSDKLSKSVLSLAISYDVIESVSKDLVSADSPPLAEIVQDVICEVNNIVGNRLRSYIHDKAGVDLTMGFPVPGAPPLGAEHVTVINLHFRIRENDRMALDLNYAPAAQ